MYQCLQGLEPQRVFWLFGQLCQIPHGSKHEKAISDFVRDFCLNLGLSVFQDEVHNLIIKKPATPGYEHAPVTILQAHLDMVCEKNEGVAHDFLKDPIAVAREGDRIYAEGTTLGADDATGVAFAMAVLERDDLSHPALEVVLTVDEEAGMSGIKALDFNWLQGRVVINLDCSDPGIVVGCAGPLLLRYDLSLSREAVAENCQGFRLMVKGLKGGHSGLDIHRQRGNANLILARLLSGLTKGYDCRIAQFHGGMQTNAICREAYALIGCDPGRVPEIRAYVDACEASVKKELAYSDPGVLVEFTLAKDQDWGDDYLTREDGQRLLDALICIDSGVVAMNSAAPQVPETSKNLGVVHTTKQGAELLPLYRTSAESKKTCIIDQNTRLARLLQAELTVLSDSPGWQYQPNSRLSQLIQEIYQRRFGQELAVEVSHGGNECGSFYQQFPDADIVCTGTQITGAHTPEESVLVSVIQKEWEMLCLTLEAMNTY